MHEEELKLLYDRYIKESKSNITFDVFKVAYEIIRSEVYKEFKKHFK